MNLGACRRGLWIGSLLLALVGCDKEAAPPTSSPPPDAGANTPCTRDAKVCPDGSAVGRTGPACEFAPCPGGEAPGSGDGHETPPDGSTACTADAKMCPDGSAVGRTAPNCEFAPCPGK